MKKTLFLICIFTTLISCSDDNLNSEFIVGQWKVTKRVESGREVELSPCDPVVVHEFKSDFSARTFEDKQISTVLCGTSDFGLYEWKKVSDNHYTRYHVHTNNLDVNYYIENNKLKLVYTPGNIAYLTRQ